ncbi:hypothetical protein D3C86_1095590 [compost metagenome]
MEQLGLFDADAVCPGLGRDALDPVGIGKALLVLSSGFVLHINAGHSLHVDSFDLLAVYGKSCRDKAFFWVKLQVLRFHVLSKILSKEIE